MTWDGESYCVEGDGEPATEERLSGMAGDRPLFELVCPLHVDGLAAAVEGGA